MDGVLRAHVVIPDHLPSKFGNRSIKLADDNPLVLEEPLDLLRPLGQ